MIIRALRRIYTIWCFFWFFVVFLILWPFFWLFLQREEHYWLANWCNRVWTVVVYTLSGLPLVIEYRFKPQKGQAYIYCPNHTSYIDIPVMLWGIRQNFSFMGKSSLAKVPLIGYMYRRLNVLVDRKSLKSKAIAYAQASTQLDKGVSLVIFPEGTIHKEAPLPGQFKEGAFRLAIEKQIPIVPVTIPYNWLILPDDGKWLGKPNKAMAIFHEPIVTAGLNLSNLKTIMEKTQEIITHEILRHNPNVCK
jgi:1-acyl-sn-glycerol-3-phosphate acyltransferase